MDPTPVISPDPPEPGGRHALVRFCPACGRLGPSPGLPALACCPDHGEAAMVPRAIAEMAQREFYRFIKQPLTDTYVQPVPDKCDRITWRGRYYYLPFIQSSNR